MPLGETAQAQGSQGLAQGTKPLAQGFRAGFFGTSLAEQEAGETKQKMMTAKLKELLDIQDDRRLEAMAIDIRKSHHFLKNRQPDQALSVLQNRRQQIKKAGKPTKETDILIKAIEEDDPELLNKLAAAETGFVLAGKLKPINKQQKEALGLMAKQPSALDQARTAQAKATTAKTVRQTELLGQANASDVKTSAVTTKYGNGASMQVRSNGTTVVTDPLGNEVKGEERLAVLKEANEQEVRQSGLKAGTRKAMTDAVDISTKAFGRLEKIGLAINNADKGIALLDKGAKTGTVMSLLPSITSASKQLDALQNRLGLDVLNTTTFGALSAGELQFALATSLPKKLSPTDLKAWLTEKRDSQQKLSDYLQNVALYMGAPGNTVASWIEAQKSLGQEVAPDVAPIGGAQAGAEDLSNLSIEELQALRAQLGGQ